MVYNEPYCSVSDWADSVLEWRVARITFLNALLAEADLDLELLERIGVEVSVDFAELVLESVDLE